MAASYRFVVIGRVQGIGYRIFAQRRAQALDLKGWVRNRPDGAVEGCATGAEAALQAFRASLQAGPPGARIDALHSTPGTSAPGERGFTILR